MSGSGHYLKDPTSGHLWKHPTRGVLLKDGVTVTPPAEHPWISDLLVKITQDGVVIFNSTISNIQPIERFPFYLGSVPPTVWVYAVNAIAWNTRFRTNSGCAYGYDDNGSVRIPYGTVTYSYGGYDIIFQFGRDAL